MAEARTSVEEDADKSEVPERVECDNVLKWDGLKLYVTENFFRGDIKIRSRDRDVTAEVGARIKSVLND